MQTFLSSLYYKDCSQINCRPSAPGLVSGIILYLSLTIMDIIKGILCMTFVNHC